METLTARQKQVFEIIKKYLDQGKAFPSLREIADALGVRNKSGMVGHLKALERKGYIRKQQRSGYYALASQSAPVIGLYEEHSLLSFPLVADIPAGTPLQTYDQSDEHLIFSPEYFGGGSLRAVSISGESMAGDHISDGDIAIIKLQKEFSLQDIVVVRVDRDEVTLKRVRYHDGWADLIPSNPNYQVKSVPADSIEILGKLVGIVRRTPSHKK